MRKVGGGARVAAVHVTGQSYPSAHAANAVGWLALAIALTVVIPTRGGGRATRGRRGREVARVGQPLLS